MPINQRQPVKLAQPIFRPHSDSPPTTTSTNKPSENSPPDKAKVENKIESSERVTPANQTVTASTPAKAPCPKVLLSQDKVQNNTVKKEDQNDSHHSSKEKIILKIKGGVVENCVTSDGNTLPGKVPKSSDTDDDEIVRKNRRLSQVIMSSGESSDDLERLQNLTRNAEKLTDNYSMLTQLALPSSFSTKSTSDSVSLLKRTPKSPVFGEPPFDVTRAPSSSKSQNDVALEKRADVKLQPFMSDRPVIGFQDIPSCSALSSVTVRILHSFTWVF